MQKHFQSHSHRVSLPVLCAALILAFVDSWCNPEKDLLLRFAVACPAAWLMDQMLRDAAAPVHGEVASAEAVMADANAVIEVPTFAAAPRRRRGLIVVTACQTHIILGSVGILECRIPITVLTEGRCHEHAQQKQQLGTSALV